MSIKYKLVHIQSEYEISGKLPAQVVSARNIFLDTMLLHVTFRRGARQMILFKVKNKWKSKDDRFKILSMQSISKERYLERLSQICPT